MKGVSVKRSRNPDCPICHCSPCVNEPRCRRGAGQAAYNQRRKAPEPSKKKVKKAKLGWFEAGSIKSKAKKAYRKAHPSASDSDVNRAGKRAVKDAKRKLR